MQVTNSSPSKMSSFSKNKIVFLKSQLAGKECHEQLALDHSFLSCFGREGVLYGEPWFEATYASLCQDCTNQMGPEKNRPVFRVSSGPTHSRQDALQLSPGRNAPPSLFTEYPCMYP